MNSSGSCVAFVIPSEENDVAAPGLLSVGWTQHSFSLADTGDKIFDRGILAAESSPSFNVIAKANHK